MNINQNRSLQIEKTRATWCFRRNNAKSLEIIVVSTFCVVRNFFVKSGKYVESRVISRHGLKPWLEAIFSGANLPEFVEPTANVTVTVGRDAVLTCIVDNLEGHKVRIDFSHCKFSDHKGIVHKYKGASINYVIYGIFVFFFLHFFLIKRPKNFESSKFRSYFSFVFNKRPKHMWFKF